MTEPAQRPQIGYDLAGNPMYAAPPVPASVGQHPTQPLQPLRVYPVGTYIAGGCLALVAFTIAAVAVALVVFGFAILAAVLGLVAVALTICVLVLRGMYRDYQKGR
ncbi:hypothetical protein [Streptomyces sp. NPDC002845]